MAGRLNFITNGASPPLADNGLKFSKSMLTEKIEMHEKFKNLFAIDKEVLGRIVQTMKASGFDGSQPVHIWHTKEKAENGEKTEHWYLIDGYTRFTACGLAGITRIPVFVHEFGDFDEAYRYVLGLQVNRRNLESDDLLKNVMLLLGTDEVQNYSGDKADLVAESYGISRRKAQRTISVIKNADEKQIEAINRGESSINKVYNELHMSKSDDGAGQGSVVPEKSSARKAEKKFSESEVRRILLYVIEKMKSGFLPELKERSVNPLDMKLNDKERSLLESLGIAEGERNGI